MSAITRTSIQRLALVGAPRPVPAVRIGGRRFASTSAPPPPPPASAHAAPQQGGTHASHLASGLAGGALVLGAIYGYYHYSGTAKVVNTARDTIGAATSAKDKLVSATPSPKDAIGLLRHAAKAYAVAVPGAAGAIDASFDQLEKLAEQHGDKVAEVAKQTYDDVIKASKSGKDAGEQITKAVGEALKKVQALVGEEGGKAFEALSSKFPDLGKALGGQAEEFQKLAAKHGPEAQKLATETYNEASQIVAKGGLNAKTLDAVKKLLTEKSQQITDLAQRSGRDAWDASAKAASPLLDQLPDVKSLLNENLDKVKQYIGDDNVDVVKGLYADLEKISKNGKSLEEQGKEAKKLVESRVGSFDDLKKRGMEQAQKGLEGVPGMGELAKFFNGTDLAELKKLAEKHGEKSQDILNSTYDEIKEILAKKVQEARKVGEEATRDAKKTASK